MTDAGVGQPLSKAEENIREAADQAYRELEGELTSNATLGDKLFNMLRARTREAPLHALAIAFVLGVMVARR